MTKIYRNLSFISFILLFFTTKLICVKTDIISASYFFSVFDLFIVFVVGFPLGLMEIVSKYVRERVSTGQYLNAKRVFHFGIAIALLYSCLITVLLMSFSRILSIKVLNGANCRLSLLLISPALIFISLIAVFKGFFLGAKMKALFNVSVVTDGVLLLASVVIFSKIFNKFGDRVYKVMYDVKIIAGFSSAGICLGITIAMLLSFCINLVLYIMFGKKIYFEDGVRRIDDIYDLGTKMIKGAFMFGLSNVFISLFVLFMQIVFKMNDNSEINSVNLYNSGILFGICMTVVGFILLFTRVYSYLDIRVVRISYNSGERQPIRNKVNDMIRQMFTYSMPVCTFIYVMSPQISSVFFKVDSIQASHFIRYTAFLPIFLCFGLMMNNILLGMRKDISPIISGGVSLAAGMIFPLIRLQNNTAGMGVLIISVYIFAVIYSVSGYIFVMKNLKYTPDVIYSVIKPLIAAVITLVISLLFKLVLGLFASDFLILIITLIVCFIAVFIIYILIHAFNYSQLARSPLGFILAPVAKVMHLFKK